MQEFNDRMEYMARDMKTYTNRAINASKKEFGVSGLTTEETKNNLPPVFYVFLSKLEDCLIQFSDPTRVGLLAKLYIDTAVIYTALLRDANFNGVSMGLDHRLVNGTNKDIIFSTKIGLHSLGVFSNYMVILSSLFEQNDNRYVTKYDRDVVYTPTSLTNTGPRISWERGDNTQYGDSGKIFIRDFADVGRNIKTGVYVKDDAVDISFVEPKNQPDYEMAFYQNFVLSKSNNNVKIRIYYSYHLNKTYEYIPNNFQLKVIKPCSNGHEMTQIKKKYEYGSDDLYYLNKTYSFHTQGSILPCFGTGYTLNDPTTPEYIGLVRGGICSIPTYGAVLDSIFGFVFEMFYPKPKEEPKVRIREFNERMEFMAKDMKMYTHRVLENSILQSCRYQFKSLKKGTDNYMDLKKVWRKEVNSPSDPGRIKFLAKLYIDTSVLYTALLRDGHFNGFSMGL
ncbi:hypothetical protein ACTFIY_000127 [Dictyostelium cf. discoideum]